jgi:rare lipoprotein A
MKNLYKSVFIFIIFFFILILQGCLPSVRFAVDKDRYETKEAVNKPTEHIYEVNPEKMSSGKVLYTEEGIASYYSYEFHGRKTANGEIFDKDKPSGAHRTLPLGTIARITNLKNGKKMVIRINDRGPFKSGRMIDVSYAAAEQLDFVKEGTAQVRIEVLEYGDNKYYK